MPIDNDRLKVYIEDINGALKLAFDNARRLQAEVQNTEGDSDLFRKLSMYLTPNINHWITGEQAGNVKDLKSVLEQRLPKVETKKGKKK